MASISQIKIDNKVYDIKDPNAMGASGGAFTGDITVQSSNPHVYVKDTNLGSSNMIDTGSFYPLQALNKDGGVIGRLTASYTSADEYGLSIMASREVNGDMKNNGIGFYIDSQGNPSMKSTSPMTFRNGIGAVDGIWPVTIGGTGGVDSGWNELNNSSVFTDADGNLGAIYYRKIGQWIDIRIGRIKLKNNLTESNIVLATLSSAYRPSKVVYGYAGNALSDHSNGLLRIATDGSIQFYKPNAVSTWTTSMTINSQVMYFVG